MPPVAVREACPLLLSGRLAPCQGGREAGPLSVRFIEDTVSYRVMLHEKVRVRARAIELVRVRARVRAR